MQRLWLYIHRVVWVREGLYFYPGISDFPQGIGMYMGDFCSHWYPCNVHFCSLVVSCFDCENPACERVSILVTPAVLVLFGIILAMLIWYKEYSTSKINIKQVVQLTSLYAVSYASVYSYWSITELGVENLGLNHSL